MNIRYLPVFRLTAILGTLILILQRISLVVAQSPNTISLLEFSQLGHGVLNGELAWRPDGKAFAVSGAQGVWIYSDTFQDITYLEAARSSGLSWKPDSSQLAAGHADGHISIWDMQTYQLIYSIPAEETHQTADHIAWSPDGSYIASNGLTNIFIWDAISGKLEQALRGRNVQHGVPIASSWLVLLIIQYKSTNLHLVGCYKP